MSVDRFMLEKGDVVLLIVDIQERLATVMEMRDPVVGNCVYLIELAKMLEIPVVVTEQYPKGLGPTVEPIRGALSSYRPVEKVAFGCCGEPSFLAELDRLGRRKVIVAGMETHICVLQTVLGLIEAGYVPHVAADAVCSRTKENWSTGLEMMRDAGAVITCTETVLFQLLKVAGTEEFKTVSRMIK
jgi:nicotinamidase-related amidase